MKIAKKALAWFFLISLGLRQVMVMDDNSPLIANNSHSNSNTSAASKHVP